MKHKVTLHLVDDYKKPVRSFEIDVDCHEPGKMLFEWDTESLMNELQRRLNANTE